MRVQILNKRWWLRFAPNMGNRGDCDGPHKPDKEMRIASELRGSERLEILIHEITHAADWHKDEEFVDQFAHDMARILWRLGYRGPESE